MTKKTVGGLSLKEGAAICVILKDGSRWLGFFERSNAVSIVLRQSNCGTPPGFIQLPLTEISEITGVILIRLGYAP